MADRNTKVRSSQIKNTEIKPEDLNASTPPIDGQVPTYDSDTEEFVWGPGGGHAQGTDPGLDIGGSNEVSAEEVHTVVNLVNEPFKLTYAADSLIVDVASGKIVYPGHIWDISGDGTTLTANSTTYVYAYTSHIYFETALVDTLTGIILYKVTTNETGVIAVVDLRLARYEAMPDGVTLNYLEVSAGVYQLKVVPEGITSTELDTTTNTALGKAHDQGTDQGLDTGGTNAVTAANCKTAYSHSQAAHAPTDAVSLTTVKSDTDVADAISKKHTSGSDAETTTTIGALINGATAKTAPVDADYVGLMDSESSNPSNILKKLSWAYIKSVFKTYFDGLYQVLSNLTTDTSLGTSDTLYPSQKAVKTYVDNHIGGIAGTFTNGNLSSGILTVTHNFALSAPYAINIIIFDNNGKEIIPDEITGATNSVAISLVSYGVLTGTWGYVYGLITGTTVTSPIPLSYLDTDVTLAANSDVKVPSQKAIKTYADTKVKNNGTVNPTNLLFNGNFECWSAGTSSAPDGWTLGGTGAAAAREASIIKLGTYSGKVTNQINTAANYNQRIDLSKGITYWKGRTVTFGCWVQCATAGSRIYLNIDDNVGSTSSAYYTTGTAWQWLTVTRTIDSSATAITCYLFINSGAVISAYFDGAMCVEGESAFAFADKPAEEGVWADYGAAPTSTIVGWSGWNNRHIWIKKIGKTVFVSYYFEGTSNSENITFTLPYANATGINIYSRCGVAMDNTSTAKPNAALAFGESSSTATVYTDIITGAAWTTSGTKYVGGQFFYESA